MLDILVLVAFVLVLLGILLVLVRAVREQGYWRLLFVLILVSFALEIGSVLFSRGTSDTTTTYLALLQTGIYLSAILALAFKKRLGIVLYALSLVWTIYDDTFHPPPFSALQSFAEDLSYAVDGAVVLLAWLVMTTDLGQFARQRRVAAAF